MQQHSLPEKDTQAKRSIHAKAEALRLHESILDASAPAVMTTTADGTIVAFNAAAEKLLRFTAAEVMGKKAPIIVQDEVRGKSEGVSLGTAEKSERAFDALKAEPGTVKPGHYEWTLIRKDNSPFPAAISVVPLR